MADFKIGSKASIEDIEITGKKVLIRVDFNVPIKDGKVTDITRISASLPTIEYCLSHNCVCILMSHLGRPDGRVVERYSLKPVASKLEEIIGKPVTFVSDCVGENVKSICDAAKPGSIILLENLRFHPEEEGKGMDKDGKKLKPTSEQVEHFRKQLSSYGDVYVNDAFGTAHRAHSSMTGITLEKRVSGFLLKKEIDYFTRVLEKPQRPFVAILGGAKVNDKIQIIRNLLTKVDALVIGGGMSYTFLKVHQNVKIGKSLFDEEGSKIVEELFEIAKKNNVEIHLPTDFVCTTEFSDQLPSKCFKTSEGIPDDYMGLDIGQETIQRFNKVIQGAKLVFWNGPLGVFEMKPFENGTFSVFETVAQETERKNLISVIGGGDSGAACVKFGFEQTVSHLSTGGGASMELLEGKVLPGLKFLSDKCEQKAK